MLRACCLVHDALAVPAPAPTPTLLSLLSLSLSSLSVCHTSPASPAAEDEDDNRYAQEEFGEQPFTDASYEDLAHPASGRSAFDVMLTTYTLFERVGQSNRCVCGC